MYLALTKCLKSHRKPNYLIFLMVAITYYAYIVYARYIYSIFFFFFLVPTAVIEYIISS